VRLLLDLGEVKFLSSVVLGRLITLWARAKASGGRIVFCNVRPEINEVFQITKLDQLFEIEAE